MGKFWQIRTELRPLIDVRNWFSLSIFGIPLPIFLKLGMRVDIVKECSVFFFFVFVFSNITLHLYGSGYDRHIKFQYKTSRAKQ